MSSVGRQSDGFSLVEVLIVLTIIGLTGVLSSFAVDRLLPHRRLGAARTAVVAALIERRNQATRDGRATEFKGLPDDFSPNLRRQIGHAILLVEHSIHFVPGGWSDGGTVVVSVAPLRATISVARPMGTVSVAPER